MRKAGIAAIALTVLPILAGCVAAGDATVGTLPGNAGAACATPEAAIAFDFPGASPARCVIEGPRDFALIIAPEHAPPINPSPWYAFRYQARPGDPVRVRLDYLGARHRYIPKLKQGETVTELGAVVAQDGQSARFDLPAGEGTVSAQPIVDAAHYDAFVGRLVRDFGGERLRLGFSKDGRPIEAVRLGRSSAPRLLVILGRQHPPEVTGTYALEAFVEVLGARMASDPALAQVQILAVPLLNPDGVTHGHWRANRGGVDLNRDWGPFTQPETRAVRDWLERAAAVTTPVAMVDFHSTNRNLFYVQGDEASAAQQSFLTAWLAGKESTYPGYAFTIEKRNANPGSGTAKNWFFERYSIPAYTYEVSDEADPAQTAEAAREISRALPSALQVLD